jgi:hypothetical protein
MAFPQELRDIAQAAHDAHRDAAKAVMDRLKEAFAPVAEWSKTPQGQAQLAEWKRQADAEAAFARSGVVLPVPPADPRT